MVSSWKTIRRGNAHLNTCQVKNWPTYRESWEDETHFRPASALAVKSEKNFLTRLMPQSSKKKVYDNCHLPLNSMRPQIASPCFSGAWTVRLERMIRAGNNICTRFDSINFIQTV